MDVDNQERLAKLEAQMENVSQTVQRIDGKLDAFTNYYVPRPEINEMFRARDQDLHDLQTELKERTQSIEHTLDNMERNKWSIRQLWPAWLAVVVAIVPLLIDIIK